MKQHFLLLLLLLLLSPQLAHAQGGWTGDLDEFIIEDGIARHQNNGKSGGAVIYKDKKGRIRLNKIQKKK